MDAQPCMLVLQIPSLRDGKELVHSYRNSEGGVQSKICKSEQIKLGS
jgi:hypothetical protein